MTGAACNSSLCFLLYMSVISFPHPSDLKKKKIRSHHSSAQNLPFSPTEPKSLTIRPSSDPRLPCSLYFSLTACFLLFFRYPKLAPPLLSFLLSGRLFRWVFKLLVLSFIQSLLKRERISLTTVTKRAPSFSS